jgi:hypothetical protein
MLFSTDAHLAVVLNTETRLYQGAVYRNHPTPSGCDRWLLAITLDKGYSTAREAAIAVNHEFPEIEPLDIYHDHFHDSAPSSIKEETMFVPALPKGAMLTWLQPNKNNMPKDAPHLVEVRQTFDVRSALLDITITPAQLLYLERNGYIEHDSSSGDDPKLNYRYDHFIVKNDTAQMGSQNLTFSLHEL